MSIVLEKSGYRTVLPTTFIAPASQEHMPVPPRTQIQIFISTT